MKPFIYDRHAKRRMRERKVTEAEVELVLKNPDFFGKSIKERINVFKFLNGRYLRVTFKEEPDYFLVVTVVVRKKPFGSDKYENRI
jgi:hypothetical protein